MSFWKTLILTTSVLSFMPVIQATSLNETHPFGDLFGVPTWDPSRNAVFLVSVDGTLWVHTGDGRIRAGSWRMDTKEDICLIVGGVFEGCFTTSRKGKVIRFTNNAIEWALEPRSDLPSDILTDAQRQTYTVMTASKGALETDRGGDEYIYFHRDGRSNVVQPEGWVKVGSWWFTDNGDLCDDINGVTDCFSIRGVSDEHLTLGLIQEGDDDIELDVRLSARSHLPPR